MKVSEKTETGPFVGLLFAAMVGIVVVVYIVANAYGFPEHDPELQPDPDVDKKVVRLQVVWMDFNSSGERVPSDRDVTITYWVDGERHSPVRDDVPGAGMWSHTFAAAVGSEIRLLVEEVERGGFKQCTILVDDRMAFPDGYQSRNDGGDCQAIGVVE